MDVYRSIENIKAIDHSILTIGSFDGLHRGHQEIIKKVISIAEATGTKSVVITFDPHPKQILMNSSPEKFETLLHINKKIELFQNMGVDILLIIPFNLEFSRTLAQDFLQNIVIKYFNPKKIIIGYDHHFGYRREGDSLFLKSYSTDSNFQVEIVNEVRDQKEIISSTKIRKLIRQGNVRRASFELGWVYGFRAHVVRGVGRGFSLEFPTANFVPENPTQLLPKRGVYFARGIINGKCVYGMCNLGYRPTFNENEFVMEIHFFEDPGKELYGEAIEVQFLERIRSEKKFNSSEELIEQLKKDREYCLNRLRIYSEEEI